MYCIQVCRERQSTRSYIVAPFLALSKGTLILIKIMEIFYSREELHCGIQYSFYATESRLDMEELLGACILVHQLSTSFRLLKQEMKTDLSVFHTETL